MKFVEKHPDIDVLSENGLTRDEIIIYFKAKNVLSVLSIDEKIREVSRKLNNMKMDIDDIEGRICGDKSKIYTESLMQSCDVADNIRAWASDVESDINEIIECSQTIEWHREYFN
jgi:hypothetical protein